MLLSKIGFLSIALSIVCNGIKAQDSSFSTARFARQPIVKKDSLHKKSFLFKAAAGVGYAGLCFLSYKFIDPDLQEDTQERLTPFQNKSARFISPLGLGTTNWVACGATALTGYIIKDKRLQQTALVWAGGLTFNDFFTNQLKESFQRHRPSSGDPYNVFDGRHGPKINKSLPSAHTSNAFATATAFATAYKNKKWLPPVAYGVATLVGVSRIYNNAHWASDVMLGAGVGYLSTKLSCWVYEKALQRKKKRQLKRCERQWSFQIIINPAHSKKESIAPSLPLRILFYILYRFFL